MSKHLYIFEDGNVKKVDSFKHGDIAACDAGIFEVIDISSAVPASYYDGEWYEVPSAEVNKWGVG